MIHLSLGAWVEWRQLSIAVWFRPESARLEIDDRGR